MTARNFPRPLGVEPPSDLELLAERDRVEAEKLAASGPACEGCHRRPATLLIQCSAQRFRTFRCDACGDAVVKNLIGQTSFAVSPLHRRVTAEITGPRRAYSVEQADGANAP